MWKANLIIAAKKNINYTFSTENYGLQDIIRDGMGEGAKVSKLYFCSELLAEHSVKILRDHLSDPECKHDDAWGCAFCSYLKFVIGEGYLYTVAL
jgi:hypothetical protein